MATAESPTFTGIAPTGTHDTVAGHGAPASRRQQSRTRTPSSSGAVAFYSFFDHGHVSIASEVGSDVTKQAASEIFFEINRLRNEPVQKEEMDLVRNYMLGFTLGDLDGPFNLSEVIRGYIIHGIDFQKFSQNIQTVKTITAQRVQELANIYFNPDSMLSVVSGSVEI